MDKIIDKFKHRDLPLMFGDYMYVGDMAWDWTKVFETRSVWKDGVEHPPGTFTKPLERKEIELAKRSANYTVNRLLIMLYERLISEYPDNIDLYNALCAVLENNCLFTRRTDVLEEMYKKFNEYWIGFELVWAYADSGDKENASRVRKLIFEREEEKKNAQH